MTDRAHDRPVHVTAEERPRPALQKIARALISLARLRRDENTTEQVSAAPPADRPAAAASDANREAYHE